MILTTIGIAVPAERWIIPPWKWVIVGVFAVGVVGLIVWAFVQSREDHERDEKEKKRDTAQETLITQVAQLQQLSARAGEKALAANQTAAQTALSGLSPGAGDFNFDGYFRISHMSVLSEQTARDMRILVAQQHPNDQVETLAKFIGIGFWAYTHEVTWPYIFRSQILALTELNAKGGIMPLAAVKAHFDKAVHDYPGAYATYGFDQWLNFMVTHSLLLKQPGDAIEITLRGRDFITFMAHWGWNADMRKF